MIEENSAPVRLALKMATIYRFIHEDAMELHGTSVQTRSQTQMEPSAMWKRRRADKRPESRAEQSRAEQSRRERLFFSACASALLCSPLLSSLAQLPLHLAASNLPLSRVTPSLTPRCKCNKKAGPISLYAVYLCKQTSSRYITSIFTLFFIERHYPRQ